MGKAFGDRLADSLEEIRDISLPLRLHLQSVPPLSNGNSVEVTTFEGEVFRVGDPVFIGKCRVRTITRVKPSA